MASGDLNHNAPRPIDAVGDPGAIAPSIQVRRWDTALFLGGMVAALVFAAALHIAWAVLDAETWIPWGNLVRGSTSLIVSTLTGGAIFGTAGPDFWEAIQPDRARWLISLGAALMAGAGITWLVSQPRDAVMHLGGLQLRTGKDAIRHAGFQSATLRGSAPAFMQLGPHLPLPKSHWTRHLMIVGGVGSGKTQILLGLIEQLIAKKAKAFIYDVKGDFTSKFPAVLISPWDRRSAIWDIGADLVGPVHAASFAASVTPTEQGQGKFWAEAAQSIITGVIRSLQNDLGNRWGWVDLAERLNQPPEALFDLLAVHFAPAAVLIKNPTATTTQSIISTVRAATRWIDDLALAWGNPDFEQRGKRAKVNARKQPLSLRAWVSDGYTGHPTLIVQAGQDPTLTARYIAAMVNILAQDLISPAMPDDEQGRTVAFVLDELGSLAKIDLPPLIDKGRSKGVVCILGMQDFGQLTMTYGKEQAQALIAMVGMHVICQVQAGETRDMLAGLFSNRRVALTNVSESSGGGTNLSVQEDTRQVVFPSQLTTLLGKQVMKPSAAFPHGFAIRAVVNLGKDPLVLDFPGIAMPSVRASFKPASWMHTPRAQPLASEQPIVETIMEAPTPEPEVDADDDAYAESDALPEGAEEAVLTPMDALIERLKRPA
jgi:hypothetical protein